MMVFRRRPLPGWISRKLPLAVSVALGIILLLAVALGINAWQANRVHRAAAEAALSEYATFAAWTYRYRIEAKHYFIATRVFEAIGGIHPEDPTRVGDPAAIMRTIDDLERCRCAPVVRGLFAFRLDVATGKAV